MGRHGVPAKGMTEFRGEVESYFRGLRDRIAAKLGTLEGRPFARKAWQRPEGGGGEMSILRGELFEKAGCNFSAVSGDRYPTAPGSGAQAEGRAAGDDQRLGIRPPRPEELAGKPFFATGVSLVMHPKNPFVPVVHMNVRYLEAGDLSWFGGGMDLTPFRPFAEDTEHFHATLREACARHGPDLYPRLSRWAREYFFIQHRNSERGVGGVFFDYLRSGDRARDFAFVREVGDAFLPAYTPLVERRRGTSFTEADRQEQLIWRGRYVEFNLIYDRGTLFGLKSGGNVEAIFMSLPPLAAW
jgi:coproporphyrinogen III oxidase